MGGFFVREGWGWCKERAASSFCTHEGERKKSETNNLASKADLFGLATATEDHRKKTGSGQGGNR